MTGDVVGVVVRLQHVLISTPMYLAGGMTSWREEKRPTESTERIDVAELSRARRRRPGSGRARAGGVGRGEQITATGSFAATSLIALVTHLAAGRGIDAAVAVAMAGGAVAGVLGGAAVAGRMPQRTLGRGFAGLVVAVAAYLLVSVAVLGGPPGS